MATKLLTNHSRFNSQRRQESRYAKTESRNNETDLRQKISNAKTVSGNKETDSRQKISYNYNHGSQTSIDYCHGPQSGIDYNHGTQSCVDYQHGVRSRLGSRMGHSAVDNSSDSSHGGHQQPTADNGGNTSEFDSLQNTAAEIIRLQQSSRLDQIRIYKESRNYQLYNDQFPKHNKRYDRPTTPDRAEIPPSKWMPLFQKWQADIAEVLEKNCMKSRVIENDEETLMRRQKNIDYCKTSESYDKYVTLLPKSQRRKSDPRTPDKFQVCGRRCWDGAIKSWRLRIHRRVDELTASKP